ncbi:hypothetical protein GCM10023115_24560 [Pontixanthobacter gangjinensis]|uniref:Type I restriction enzyme HsdR N-terminal domain-containing protein n=1 Tax=Christiangramia aestuarii TaxID=1028746 RepID=A0A7K1LTI6_9FLAO|nr:type I restriction enzyme HsdR N-terminal domain-containing protein [Christiangramia aestuarii]MUP43911.1 type I restriction enzyme HsdR N-terminal domain-containing protein [Christiangramia aestuarii]
MEQNIRKKFIEFLKSKKDFNQNQFIIDYEIPLGTKKYIAADLVIIEPNIREFLAFIEFKSYHSTEVFQTLNEQIKRNRVLQDLRYIPFYLITGDENDFVINKFENDNWIEITKDDFPNYNQLSTNAINRIKFKEREEEINQERDELVRRKNKGIASLISMMIASIAVASGIFFIKNSDIGLFQSPEKSDILLDSLKNKIERNFEKTELLSNRYEKTLILNDSLAKTISNSDNIQFLTLSEKINNLENKDTLLNFRFNQLARIITKDPLNTLELNNLKTELTLSKKDFNTDIEIITRDINSMNQKIEYKYNVIITLLGALLASILVLAIPNLLQWKKSSK